MALSTSLIENTATVGTASIRNPDFSKFTVTSYKGNECILDSIEAPLDATNRMRFARAKVSNIYNGTGIRPEDQWPSREGFKLLIGRYRNLKTTDSSMARFRALTPLSVSLAITYPRVDFLTVEHLRLAIADVVGTIIENNASTTGFHQLTNLMQGNLNPHFWD